jgi:hypothetical protein
MLQRGTLNSGYKFKLNPNQAPPFEGRLGGMFFISLFYAQQNNPI